MITIHFNGDLIHLPPDLTLAEALRTQGLSEGCFAVVLNRQVIPRSQYLTTSLNQNDRIEILLPMQGG